MSGVAVTLNRIDLESFRCLETLSNRLSHELKQVGGLQVRIDLLESFIDGQKVGRMRSETEKEDSKTPDEIMVDLVSELEGSLKQMTIGVWNAGQKLRRLREETQGLEREIADEAPPEE